MNPRYITEGTMPDGTRAPHDEGPFYIFDTVKEEYLPMVFTDPGRANVVRDLLTAEDEAMYPPEKLMRCTVELLIPVTRNARPVEAEDAVSALLQDYAEARGMIRDWRYASDANGRYLYPVAIDADTWAREDG